MSLIRLRIHQILLRGYELHTKPHLDRLRVNWLKQEKKNSFAWLQRLLSPTDWTNSFFEWWWIDHNLPVVWTDEFVVDFTSTSNATTKPKWTTKGILFACLSAVHRKPQQMQSFKPFGISQRFFHMYHESDCRQVYSVYVMRF